MKKFIIILLVFMSFNLTSMYSLEYKMVDLGTMISEKSTALAINEKGQVLGRIRDKRHEDLFLWDNENGLKIIEVPACNKYERYWLNNNGQIAGSYTINESKRAFLWDPQNGFSDIGTPNGGEIYISSFNDKGQILAFTNTYDWENEYVDTHIFLWDNGNFIDLTEIFRNQVRGVWLNFIPLTLNNLGHVVIGAMHSEYFVEKSFVYKNGKFSMIMPEKSPDTTVRVLQMDDNENIIIQTVNNYSDKFYFISYSEGFSALIINDYYQEYVIRNNRPLLIGHLQGSLKKDKEGNYYFAPGLSIVKLLKEESPFYDLKNSIHIWDQNSKGYAVGSSDTIFPERHAFLAIPIQK